MINNFIITRKNDFVWKIFCDFGRNFLKISRAGWVGNAGLTEAGCRVSNSKIMIFPEVIPVMLAWMEVGG